MHNGSYDVYDDATLRSSEAKLFWPKVCDDKRNTREAFVCRFLMTNFFDMAWANGTSYYLPILRAAILEWIGNLL